MFFNVFVKSNYFLVAKFPRIMVNYSQKLGSEIIDYFFSMSSKKESIAEQQVKFLLGSLNWSQTKITREFWSVMAR